MATLLPLPDEVSAPGGILSGDTMHDLAIVLDALNIAPYNTPPEKLQRAYEAVVAARVQATEDPGIFCVGSAQPAEGSYTVQHGFCTCPSGQTHLHEAFSCYHTVAAQLYQRWQQHQRSLVAPSPEQDVAMAPVTPESLRMPQDVSHVPLPDEASAPRGILFGDTMDGLTIVLDELNIAPYNTPPEKLQKAYAAVLETRVEATKDPQQFLVRSRTAPTQYCVTRGSCTCPYGEHHPKDVYGCYHTVAAKLYQRWQQNQRPLLSPPVTPPPSLAPVTDASLPLEACQRPQETSETRLHALALPRRSITAIVSDLSKPLPRECLGSFQRKGVTIYFVPWTTVALLLDTYAPGWSGAITRLEKIGERLAVTYRLTIPAAEGLCTQEDGGMEDEEKEDYGDAFTSAIATAMKRAAAKFGVGRTLYHRTETATALEAYLKAERTQALAELGSAVDAAHLDRATTIAWLRRETGVQSNAQIPLAAIRALTLHLSA